MSGMHVGASADRADGPQWGEQAAPPVTDLSPRVSPRNTHPDQRKRAHGDRGDRGDTPTVTTPSARTSWTAAELVATDFPEPRFAVPGIIPEGVTLLVGAPKLGKSWLGLGLGVAVASDNGKALGRLDVVQGDVLYLALEDTPRRLKSRLVKLLGPTEAPKRLQIETAWRPLDDGGGQDIADWLQTHPGARLVIIDVLKRIKSHTPPGISYYDSDYVGIARIKQIADQFGVAIVAVHHTRKQGADDYLDEVSGTAGLTGAADAIAVLKRSRGQAAAVLHLTGRDVDEHDYALDFTKDRGLWTLLDGPAEQFTVGDTRAAILATVSMFPEGIGPKALADACKVEYGLTKKTLGRMVEDNQLTTDGRGLYFPVTPVPAVTGVTPVTPVTIPGQGGQSCGACMTGRHDMCSMPDECTCCDWYAANGPLLEDGQQRAGHPRATSRQGGQS